MAFVPRQKDNGNKPKEGIEVESVDSRSNESSAKSNPYSIQEVKSFKDQAIEVLNILDKKGINIYDEDRKPGMYLRSNKTDHKNIVNILSGRKSESLSQHQQQQESSNETKSSNPVNGLLDFFNNR